MGAFPNQVPEEPQYERDDAGNVIDPPVMQMHERAVADAAATGDARMVEYRMKQYHEDRHAFVDSVTGSTDETATEENSDDGGDAPSRIDPDDYTYDQLREMAGKREISQAGTKPELADRINQHDFRSED